MVKAQDVETQIKGRVCVIWMADTNNGMDRTAAWEIGRMLKGLPTQFSALHICVPSLRLHFAHGSLVALGCYAIGKLTLLRLKTHFGKVRVVSTWRSNAFWSHLVLVSVCPPGTPVELKNTLQDYGIPASIIPISDEGHIDTKDCNLKWKHFRIEERQRRAVQNFKQQSKAAMSTVESVLEETGTKGSNDNGEDAEEEDEDEKDWISSEDLWMEFTPKALPVPTDGATSSSHSISSDSFSPTSFCDPPLAVPAPTQQLPTASPKKSSSRVTGGARVFTPSNNDILLGRGRFCQEFVVRYGTHATQPIKQNLATVGSWILMISFVLFLFMFGRAMFAFET